jgi:predicted DNA-binding protein
MIPEKYIKEINGYYLLEEAIHPESKVLYKLGDIVLKKDDHIMYGSGKNYTEVINTMFCTKDCDYIYCSEEVFKDSEFRRRHWASRPKGYYLDEVIRKVSNKELNEIEKAKSLLRNFI